MTDNNSFAQSAGDNEKNPKESCGNCQFYYYRGGSYAIVGVSICRKNPPEHIGWWSGTNFPNVSSNSWCGDWKSKTTTETRL